MRRNWQVWLDKYGDPDWRLWHRMWSVRIALLTTVLNGLYGAWPAFMEYVPPFEYAMINVTLAIAVFVARLTNQSGFDNGSS